MEIRLTKSTLTFLEVLVLIIIALGGLAFVLNNNSEREEKRELEKVETSAQLYDDCIEFLIQEYSQSEAVETARYYCTNSARPEYDPTCTWMIDDWKRAEVEIEQECRDKYLR